MRDMAQVTGTLPIGMVRPFEEYKSFSVLATNPGTGLQQLAMAEFSLLDFSIVHDELGDGIARLGQTWYWFARLNVPPAIRRLGIATRLMESAVKWADSRHVHVLLGINPYGDMSFEQLKEFYMKFGFVMGPHELLYRIPGGK